MIMHVFSMVTLRLLLTAIVLAMCAIPVVAQTPGRYAGRPLADVLRDLQSLGLKVAFSSELVRPEMRVVSEPKSTSPRQILDEVLEPHALRATSGPKGTWLVVRARKTATTAVSGPVRREPADGARTVERTLSGVVIRSDTGAPIDGTTVASGDKTARTGKDGRFSLRLPAAHASITVSAAAFFTLTTAVDLTERDITDAEFVLTSQPGFASRVEVVSVAPSTSPSATPVAPRDVLRTPGAVDNVFRTLHTLPGVSAMQEFSSRLTVRGGAPDQNLTVMDGVEVHDPFRLFGLASAFNPEIIQHFELATSGFSAKYGDRLSSLLLVENRDGDRSRRFGTSGSLSVTDGNMVFEGKLPGRATGSWLVTGRRTYYDLIAGRIVDAKLPQFADLQAKAVWEPGSGRKLTFFALRSRQSARVDDDRPEDGEFVHLDDDTRNDLAWMRVDTRVGARGHSTTVAGYSRTSANFGFDGHYQTGFERRSNAPFELPKPFEDMVFSRQLEVSDASARQELAWSLGAHTVDVGGELHQLRTYLKFVLPSNRTPGPPIGGSSAQSAGLPDLLDSRLNSTRAGGWVIGTWRAGTRARVETGLRLDRTSINAETTLSPRLAASFAVNPKLHARASFGRFTQSPGYEKTSQGDYILNFTADTAASLRSERASLASMGLEQTLRSGVSLRVETYYKRFTDLLMPRLETEPERLARLAQYNFPPSLASSLPVEPVLTTVPTNDGRGRAYGVDLLLSRMTAPVDARLRGWISYTWGKATLDAYGRTYPFEYDRGHAVSAVVSYRLSRKWELGATSRWATGFPRTPPLGVRAVGEERAGPNGTVIVPARDTRGFVIYEGDYGGVSNLNSARLPAFARTDIRVSWKSHALSRWEYYAEVINVLNRENASSVRVELVYDPTSNRPRITEVRSGGLTLVPTVGVRWRF